MARVKAYFLKYRQEHCFDDDAHFGAQSFGHERWWETHEERLKATNDDEAKAEAKEILAKAWPCSSCGYDGKKQRVSLFQRSETVTERVLT